MLAKLASITVGDVWSYLWRTLVWSIIVGVAALLLGFEPSWKIFVLLGIASFSESMLDSRKRF